ncbi:MAG: TlpA family protein disulfide reductase [Mucilaginibacter sp.]
MKKASTCFLLSFLLITTAFCQNLNPGRPVDEPAKILKDFGSFLDYMSDNLKNYSEDFTAYNAASKVISKDYYMKMLCTGNYIPLRLSSAGGKLSYKLYKVNPTVRKDIREASKGWAEEAYANFKKEGKRFPDFNFVDLNGNRYNAATTRGKTIVLKCWFIGCLNCEAEMPDLNEMVKQYKNRKDIVFVSLALDSKEKLKAFLKRKPFSYAIIPDQETYITKNLNVREFPTHFIINKQRIVVKVVNTADELASALKKMN